MQDPPLTKRLFFAFTPPAAQNAELAERIAPIVTRLGAQRVPPENFHVTLCFLGAVAPEKLPLLRDVAAGVHGVGATLRFDVLEHWARPQVLCATAGDAGAAAPARELSQRLAAACTDAGFAPDVKPFRAHLTMARKVHRPSADGFLPRALMPPFVVSFDRFVLMESRRGESGSVYSPVDSWPLD